MKIVFLDEYTLGTTDTSAIKELASEYRGYEITTGQEQTIERARGFQVIVCNKTPITAEVLKALSPTLKLVAITATGMNNVDLNAAAELGIEVRNAAGYSTSSVAEATLGAALSLRRHNTIFDNYVKSGEYSRSGRMFYFPRPISELRGSRWGIIGLGSIGHEVARLASAFGCDIRYFSTSGAKRLELYTRCETLEELLSWSDIVSIHSPLNAQTANLIGAKELAMMQPSASLINVARGGIIDEEALVAALKNGTISNAALDVFAQEPLAENSPLINTPEISDRVLLTPHNAWASEVALDTLVHYVAKNIADLK